MKVFVSLFLLVISAIISFGQGTDVKKFASESEVPRITIEDAKKGFDNGSVIFVDSRSLDAYEAERIKGAFIIKGAAEDRFASLPKGKKIIVYCT